MNPLAFRPYFFPGGGAGIWTLAVLANSSKLCGRRWFCLIQLIIARFKDCKVVNEPELVVADPSEYAIGIELGAGAGAGAGVAVTVTELACGGGVAAWLPDLPQPAAIVTSASNKDIVFGRQPDNRPKSKNDFIAR